MFKTSFFLKICLHAFMIVISLYFYKSSFPFFTVFSFLLMPSKCLPFHGFFWWVGGGSYSNKNWCLTHPICPSQMNWNFCFSWSLMDPAWQRIHFWAYTQNLQGKGMRSQNGVYSFYLEEITISSVNISLAHVSYVVKPNFWVQSYHMS